MRAGRPLRFLAATLAGWTGLRAFLLWPVPDAAIASDQVRVERPAAVRASALPVLAAVPVVPLERLPALPSVTAYARPYSVSEPVGAGTVEQVVSVSVTVGSPAEPAVKAVSTQGALTVPAPPKPRGPGRWSGSAWAIARPSGTGGGLGASQLGGSQAGARLAYALGAGRRVAVVGRVATALEGCCREAALGVEWRPGRLPVRLFAEQRFAIGKGRGGPSAGVIGGVYEALPHGFRLEAYGQAGVIGRDRVEGFADGAVRTTRAVAKLGPATVDLGAGAWGGAQRGAERVDVGPTLGVAVPVGGRSVRLTLDYRARVAGRARPGSGPALSLGTDF